MSDQVESYAEKLKFGAKQDLAGKDQENKSTKNSTMHETRSEVSLADSRQS